jgi:hypothetical protein
MTPRSRNSCSPGHKGLVTQNQREKRQRDHDHSNCIEAVPALPLFLPIWWKLLDIPSFHLVIDRHRGPRRLKTMIASQSNVAAPVEP